MAITRINTSRRSTRYHTSLSSGELYRNSGLFASFRPERGLLLQMLRMLHLLHLLHLLCCNIAGGAGLFCEAGVVRRGVEAASYGCDFLREVHTPESRTYSAVVVAGTLD